MPEDGNAGVGLIYPPPDVRGVIDKTAQFVAKCGPEFEQRVLREQNHAKFSFLLPNNPYRQYYEHKVKEFKTGVVEEAKPDVPKAIIEQKAKDEAKKQKKEQKMLTLGGEKKKKVAKPPPPDQYVVSHPYIAPMDMDIIKLTAQFVARNGQKFLIGLTQRESRNPQFDFLKPTHALFGYFTSLVDAYTKCLMPNKDEIDKLTKFAESPQDILDKAMSRFAWDEQEEEKRAHREEEEKEEKDQMAQIDWHDFVVVETIEFTAEDNNIPLAAPIDVKTGAPQGPPVALDASGKGSISQAAKIEKPKEVDEEEKDEPVVDREKEEKAKELEKRALEEKEKEEREKEEEERKQREQEEREREERERQEAERAEEEAAELEPEIPLPAAEPEMKVRKDYVRHKKASAQRLTQRCPITGQLIPAEEMSNHLKVLLLDPKWKHQKDALVERARKESAFADDVEANLAGFVAKRPDLFGSVDEQIREAAEAGAEAAARDAGADAGPAHTMVAAAATTDDKKALPGQKVPGQAALTSSAGNVPALPGLAGGGVGPTLGVSTVNSRLTSCPPVQPAGRPAQAQGAPRPVGVVAQTPPAMMDYGDDDDDDEPMAKKPRLDDGSLLPEAQWLQRHPGPIQVRIQVSLGAEGAMANVPPFLTEQVLLRMSVLQVKQMLTPKVQAAGVNPTNMKLKAMGYILKNNHSLAFYNLAPGASIELQKKQRGGR